MRIETLDGDFYRERARLCRELAESAAAAKPLFARLFFLAKAYEERARAADRSIDSSDGPNALHRLPQRLAR